MSAATNETTNNEEQPNDPISAARLAANRENAKKSTGPTSTAGKAITRLNAVKCGLTGTNRVFSNKAEADRYTAHIRDYETLHKPVGPEESAVVQSIADLRWRLNRIPGLEQAILAIAGAEVVLKRPGMACDEAESALELEARRRHEKELRNLNLQENRLSRRRERETAELERLQSLRKANEEEALREGAKEALLSQHHGEQSTVIAGLGFVFSTQRFAKYMKLLTPSQRAKLLQEALAEASEEPKTQEAAV